MAGPTTTVAAERRVASSGSLERVLPECEEVLEEFPAATTQVSAALNYSGTIERSPTFGLRNTMYVGPLRPWQILIPPGVAHRYKVVGHEDALLVYLAGRLYNPQDEGRIAYNHPSIHYDWETQHK